MNEEAVPPLQRLMAPLSSSSDLSPSSSSGAPTTDARRARRSGPSSSSSSSSSGRRARRAHTVRDAPVRDPVPPSERLRQFADNIVSEVLSDRRRQQQQAEGVANWHAETRRAIGSADPLRGLRQIQRPPNVPASSDEDTTSANDDNDNEEDDDRDGNNSRAERRRRRRLAAAAAAAENNNNNNSVAIYMSLDAAYSQIVEQHYADSVSRSRAFGDPIVAARNPETYLSGCAICDIGHPASGMTRVPHAAQNFRRLNEDFVRDMAVVDLPTLYVQYSAKYYATMYRLPEEMARYGQAPMPHMSPADVQRHFEQHTSFTYFQLIRHQRCCMRVVEVLSSRFLDAETQLPDVKTGQLLKQFIELWRQLATMPTDGLLFTSEMGGTTREFGTIDPRRVNAIANMHAFEQQQAATRPSSGAAFSTTSASDTGTSAHIRQAEGRPPMSFLQLAAPPAPAPAPAPESPRVANHNRHVHPLQMDHIIGDSMSSSAAAPARR